MLTTMAVMALGMGQANVRSSSSDRVGPQNIPFSNSFDESAAEQVVVELRDTRTLALSTGVDEVAAVLGRAKTKEIGGHAVSEPEAVQVAAGSKTTAGSTSLLGNVLPKTAAGQVTTEDVDGLRAAVVKSGDVDDDAAAGGSQMKIATDTGKTVELNQPEASGQGIDEELPTSQEELPLSGNTPVVSELTATVKAADRVPISSSREDLPVQKETTKAGGIKSTTPPRRTDRIQENVTASKTMSKTTAKETEALAGTESTDAMPALVQVVPISDAQRNVIGGARGDSPYEMVFLSAARSSAVPTATTNATAGKDHAQVGNVVDDKKVVAPDVDENTSASGTEFAKTVALAVSPVTDDDGKMPSAIAAAVVSHVAGGTSGVVSDYVSGVASAHSPGAATVAKPQPGDTNAHTASLQTGTEVLDGSGATAMTETHRTLMATPNTLEVGIANGTHGWLKIRADMASNGVVNASLSTSSPSGQEMLHKELSSLTAYLQGESVAVNTVSVHSASAPRSDSAEFTGGTARERGAQTGQQGSQTGEGQRGATSLPSVLGKNRVGEDGLLSSATFGGGSWLSVRA